MKIRKRSHANRLWNKNISCKAVLSYGVVTAMTLGCMFREYSVSYATAGAATEATVAPTEATAAPTEATVAPTEAPTAAPTEATTAPTESSTAATEATTGVPTESATNKTSESKDKTTESKDKTTEKKTEATTQQSRPINNGVTDASVDKARKDLEEAEKQKEAAQEILDSLESAKDNIEEYIVELDKSLSDIQNEITDLEKNQKELQESIEKTQTKLEIAKMEQNNQYIAMKQRIQMVYESGNKSYLDVLLTATSMTDMLNKTEYVTQVSFYDYSILQQLIDAKEEVANLKLKLDSDLAANEELQEEVKAQKNTLEILVEEKNAQVAIYEESITEQQEEVEKYAQAQAQAEAIIAAAEQMSYSSGYVGDYTGGAFTWPASGNYTITSYYGLRNSPTAGASSDHKGLDIACNIGDPVVAAADGVVIVSTYNYAEGNYICIDHGSGIVSVYMHNSALLVSVGESVVAGQQIAAAGSTGYSTGPHVHFGVRVNGTYVDPLSYLQ